MDIDGEKIEDARGRIWDLWREWLFNSNYKPNNVGEALEDMEALWEDAATMTLAFEALQKASS